MYKLKFLQLIRCIARLKVTTRVHLSLWKIKDNYELSITVLIFYIFRAKGHIGNGKYTISGRGTQPSMENRR